ncbi:hypothetical protein [Erythrobacter sp. HI0063]|uniref:hypothetical protein n=1 Tax=Erythrobacter sp. HI0063 TaxID=1822240 RepID=UPI0012E8DB46|nr:hypothetical protein [Erythrobacter sp. HI0063]
MSKNKGGRPAHHDGETKKAAIAVRTAPSVRDALKAAADENGRSITQEVEKRLIVSFEADGGQRSSETERLLAKFAAEIAEIEQMTGKRWHKDRKTAGAVLEMFRRLPNHLVRTDDPYDDEFVSRTWDALYAARQETLKLMEHLRDFGISPWEQSYMKGRLFGNSSATPRRPEGQLGGILGRLAGVADMDRRELGRWREREQLERLELPPEAKRHALALIELLEGADERELSANEAHSEAIAPYLQAEEEGRTLYRSSKRRAAEMAVARGDDFSISDLF